MTLYKLRFPNYELQNAIWDSRIVNHISQKFYMICELWIMQSDCEANVHQLRVHSHFWSVRSNYVLSHFESTNV